MGCNHYRDGVTLCKYSDGGEVVLFANVDLIPRFDVGLAPMELTWLEQLILLRMRRGWSQRKLAVSVGVSRQSVHAIMSGKQSPRVELVEAMVKAMGGTMTITIDPPEGLR